MQASKREFSCLSMVELSAVALLISSCVDGSVLSEVLRGVDGMSGVSSGVSTGFKLLKVVG